MYLCHSSYCWPHLMTFKNWQGKVPIGPLVWFSRTFSCYCRAVLNISWHVYCIQHRFYNISITLQNVFLQQYFLGAIFLSEIPTASQHLIETFWFYITPYLVILLFLKFYFWVLQNWTYKTFYTEIIDGKVDSVWVIADSARNGQNW